MLMMDLSDYGAKSMKSRYCRYCTNAEGMLQSPQERLQRLTNFIMEDGKLPEEKAREEAVKQMRKMPAWKGKI
jgi:hypothetical protein